MSRDADEPTVGPWAREKLECLKKYLSAYIKILDAQKKRYGYKWSIIYIDAFAGAGEYLVRSHKTSMDKQLDLMDQGNEEYINGSARVALEIKPPFDLYIFIETNKQRIVQLENLKTEFAERKILIREMDCRTYLEEKFVNNLRPKDHRAVVLLDPFGMQVPWPTLDKLGKTKAVEVIINFPVGMAIQRFLRKQGVFAPDERQRLDDYFGSPEWFDLIYRSERDLLGDRYVKAEDAAKILVQWYRERLRLLFNYVSTARLVRNTRGGHLYYLIHAGPNKTGSKIASYILSQGENIN